LTSVRGQNLNTLSVVQKMLEELDLLSIEGDDTDLRLLNTTSDERLRELTDELCFCAILNEVANARVRSW